MILGFGVIMLAVIGAIGGAFAAPLAALWAALSRPKDDEHSGGVLLRWVLCTAVVIVVQFLGLSGNAASGVEVYGAQIEDLLALAPWLLLLAAGIHLGFWWVRRPPTPPRRPPGDD